MQTPEPDGQTTKSTNETPNVTCTVFRKGHPTPSLKNLQDISVFLEEPDVLVWFDVVDPTPTTLDILRDEFNLHPLSIEDAVYAHERPKIESYGDYYFIVVLGASTDASHQVRLHEISIFVGRNFLVTVRHDPVFPIEDIKRRWSSHEEDLRHTASFLLYMLLDSVVDGYFPVVDAFEDRVEGFERALFEQTAGENDLLQNIFQMRRQGQQFRRAVTPMRDILNPIIRGDLSFFPNDEVIYFRDVYDHAARVLDQIDTLRDMMGSALEIHLSVIANRQNEVSKQLTIIATVFLPLSFIVGFFGQNFAFLVQHITGLGSFLWLGLGSEAVAVIALAIFFRYRGWF